MPAMGTVDSSSHHLGWLSRWLTLWQQPIAVDDKNFPWGAYTERKVKITLTMISLRRRKLSEMSWTSISSSAQLPTNSMPAPLSSNSHAQKNWNLQTLPVGMRTCIPVFLLITLVDSSPRQCLLLFFCGDSHILCANSELDLVFYSSWSSWYSWSWSRASMTYCDGWTILLTSESKRSLGCYRHSSLDG